MVKLDVDKVISELSLDEKVALTAGELYSFTCPPRQLTNCFSLYRNRLLAHRRCKATQYPVATHL